MTERTDIDELLMRPVACSAPPAFHGRPDPTAGLVELLKAHDYAEDVDCDIWDFAVELATLRHHGLSQTDLRWLVCKKYVEHRLEVTVAGDETRRFQSTNPLHLRSRSCFAPTAAGMAFLSRQFQRQHARTADYPLVVDATDSRNPLRPFWDGMRRELRIAERVVKTFAKPAPNQERLLAAFQEEGWPRRIDDPLAPVDSVDPKQRLHDTIKCLNRGQKDRRLIQFCGDGTGEGVVWQFKARTCDIFGPLCQFT